MSDIHFFDDLAGMGAKQKSRLPMLMHRKLCKSNDRSKVPKCCATTHGEALSVCFLFAFDLSCK